MTLEEIEKMNAEFLDIPTVSKYLNRNPQYIKESIRRGVPWGYMLGNTDFRIPKRAFVNCHRHGHFNEKIPVLEPAGNEKLLPVKNRSKEPANFDMQEMITRITEMSKQMNVILGIMENARNIFKK